MVRISNPIIAGIDRTAEIESTSRLKVDSNLIKKNLTGSRSNRISLMCASLRVDLEPSYLTNPSF